MHGDDSWIQTYSGRQFWPLDPHPDDVYIGDIAHALALKCRFAGHCLTFYSVAQHSVTGSRLVSRENALWFLLHDAAEAYLFDCPRPIKVNRPWIREDEDRVMRCICKKFGLSEEEPEEVKRVDRIMLLTESRDVMAPVPKPWQNYGLAPISGNIIAWTWQDSEREFLQRFKELVYS